MKRGNLKEFGHTVPTLSEGWLKAAVIGSLWASVEIVLGSFLHNIKMPMSGTVMSFISVMLLIAFSQIWKERWIILRSGIICALMKSVSPSAIIIGPMIGITMEAVVIELMLLLFGRNLLAYIAGGALAVTGVLVQKVIGLLIAFGLNFAVIFHNLVDYAVKQLSFTGISPLTALLMLIAIYLITGAWAAVTGYFLGRRALNRDKTKGLYYYEVTERRHPLFEQNKPDHYRSYLLLVHISFIVLSLYLISNAPAMFLLIPGMYIILTLIHYKKIIRRLTRPFFWIQLVVITLLASLFLNGLKEGVVLSRQGIIAGLLMNLRAVLIFTGFSAISVELRNPFIKQILYGRGFGKIYTAVGLAFGALPGILAGTPKGREVIRKPGSVITSMVRSGDLLFRKFREDSFLSPPVFLITGRVMTGKSSYAGRLVDQLREKGVRIAGFLASGVDQDQERLGFDLLNLQTGKKTLLSRKDPVPEDWIRYGRYAFDPEAFEMANREIILQSEQDPEILFLDEVGPLELQNLGWAPTIESQLISCCTLQLWIVRKSLIEKVIKKWNLQRVSVIDIEITSTEALLEMLLEEIMANSYKSKS